MGAIASTGSELYGRELSHAVRDLAAELLPTTPELSRGLTDHLFAAIPELASSDDPGLWEETRASSEANLTEVLRLMKLGAGPDALVVPAEAADFVRGLVHRGIPLAALLRSYRLGHGWFWDRWSRALDRKLADAPDLLAERDLSSAFMFAYVDRISDVLVEEYGTEQERTKRSAAILRAETVRTILAGEVVDEEVASKRLGYELRRHHLALHLAAAGTELRGLERAASEAARVVGTGEPLIIQSGAATVNVWCGAYEPLDPAALMSYQPPDGIRITVGMPAHGLSGFRDSHVQALRAARVTALAGAQARAVTTYRAVELVALLAADLPSARAFVASRLGPLAADDEPTARLRDTALAFLRANGSVTRVAKELFVHQNTVSYRVKRAEELLGRRVGEEPIELVCALTLASTLGPAVLTNADPPSSRRSAP